MKSSAAKESAPSQSTQYHSTDHFSSPHRALHPPSSQSTTPLPPLPPHSYPPFPHSPLPLTHRCECSWSALRSLLLWNSINLYSISIQNIFRSQITSVRIIRQIFVVQEAVQKHGCLLLLVLRHHVAGSLHRCEGEPSEFPDHACHLVLVLVDSRSPPFSPLVDHGDTELVLHSCDPVHSARNRHTVIHITRSDPDPQSSLDEDGIEPIAGVGELRVVGGHVVAAGLEVSEGQMQLRLDGGLIEEVADSEHILTDDSVSHGRGESTMGQSVELLLLLRDLLEEALGVEVEHAGVGSVEFLVRHFPHLFAGVALVAQDADGLDHVVLMLSVVSVIVEVFVLVDTHLNVVSGFIALPGFGAGVVDHDALKVDGEFAGGKRVSFEDFVGEVGHVDAGVAFSGEVEFVLFEVGELVEELHERLVVVGSNGAVVVLEAALGSAEAHSARRLNVQQIRPHVPRVRINRERNSPLLEHEGAVFVGHSKETGAARSSIQPQHDGIIIGIPLGVEEHIVEGGGIEVEKAWISKRVPEYHLWAVQPGMTRCTSSSAGAAIARATSAITNRYFIKIYNQYKLNPNPRLIPHCLPPPTFRIIKLLMKKQRNIPVLHEVMERQNEYESHLVKLQRIQAERKHSLARKSLYEKTVMVQHIKNQKHNNFIQKLEKESQRINHENLKFVEKLTRANVTISSRSRRSSLSQTSLSYSVKKSKEKEINRENERIFQKLNNSCPFVNTQKINEQYNEIKKISDRLRKYDDSCELKTKKYARSSTLSISGNIRFSVPVMDRGNKKSFKDKFRPRIAQFYSKDDILKNKIEHRGIPSAKVLLGAMDRKRGSQQKYYDFFNTQVNPQTSS